MSFSKDLIDQAEHLASKEVKKPRQASLRRATSNAYYALFHFLTWEAVQLIGGNASEEARMLMQRWFNHSAMLQACSAFSGTTLNGALSKMAGTKPLPQIQLVARSFRELQESRHSADYDMISAWKRIRTKQNIQMAKDAMEAWNEVKKESQASIFALALLDLKRVQTERS